MSESFSDFEDEDYFTQPPSNGQKKVTEWEGARLHVQKSSEITLRTPPPKPQKQSILPFKNPTDGMREKPKEKSKKQVQTMLTFSRPPVPDKELLYVSKSNKVKWRRNGKQGSVWFKKGVAHVGKKFLDLSKEKGWVVHRSKRMVFLRKGDQGLCLEWDKEEDTPLIGNWKQQ